MTEDPIVQFVVYDEATGRVLRFGVSPRSMVEIQANAENEVAIESSGHDDTHWFNGTEIVPKSPLPTFDSNLIVADGVSEATIVGLPNPTTVVISGAGDDELTVTDGTLALSFDTPGRYVVKLAAGVSYLATVEVIDAA